MSVLSDSLLAVGLGAEPLGVTSNINFSFNDILLVCPIAGAAFQIMLLRQVVRIAMFADYLRNHLDKQIRQLSGNPEIGLGWLRYYSRSGLRRAKHPIYEQVLTIIEFSMPLLMGFLGLILYVLLGYSLTSVSFIVSLSISAIAVIMTIWIGIASLLLQINEK